MRNWEIIITSNFIFYCRQNGCLLTCLQWTDVICSSTAFFSCEGSCVLNTVPCKALDAFGHGCVEGRQGEGDEDIKEK